MGQRKAKTGRSFHVWCPVQQHASLVASVVEMPPGSGEWFVAVADLEAPQATHTARELVRLTRFMKLPETRP